MGKGSSGTAKCEMLGERSVGCRTGPKRGRQTRNSSHPALRLQHNVLGLGSGKESPEVKKNKWTKKKRSDRDRGGPLAREEAKVWRTISRTMESRRSQLRPILLNQTIGSRSQITTRQCRHGERKHRNHSSGIRTTCDFFFFLTSAGCRQWLGKFARFCLILKRVFFLLNGLHVCTASC